MLKFVNCCGTGCGFVGRHLVSFLVNEGLVSHVRIVDKVPPPMAWLNDCQLKAFNSPIVEFKSANLLNTGFKIILCLDLYVLFSHLKLFFKFPEKMHFLQMTIIGVTIGILS